MSEVSAKTKKPKMPKAEKGSQVADGKTRKKKKKTKKVDEPSAVKKLNGGESKEKKPKKKKKNKTKVDGEGPTKEKKKKKKKKSVAKESDEQKTEKQPNGELQHESDKKKKEKSAPTPEGEYGACSCQDCGCESFWGDGTTCQNCGHSQGEHAPPLVVTKSPNKNKKKEDAPVIRPTDSPEEITKKFREGVHGLMTTFSWEIDSAELNFKQRLGEGASAKVWKGEYRGQEVAIKVLKDKVEPEQLRDFKKEFELFGSLRSPHIVFFFGACVQPSLCMVIEWCANGSLFDVLKSNRKIDWDQCFKFINQTIRGINCLHEWKPTIVHRDLKSLNLLVDQGWTIKVADFGLSRTTEDDNQCTLNKLRGTYAYTAPEVYFGNKYTTKSDIFSLAIILWELIARVLTGTYKSPYSEYKQLVFDFQIIIATAKKSLRPSIPASCPEPIAKVITTSWDKDAELRPSCMQLSETFKEIEKEYRNNKKVWDALLPSE